MKPSLRGLVLSALSGVLLSASMPGYLNAGFLGWMALVPLLAAVEGEPEVKPRLLAMPFALIWSLAVHNWYIDVFPLPLGILLMLGAGSWYSLVIGLGISLGRKAGGAFRLLALPLVWSALEFLKFTAPVVRDWWFVLLAKSQWGFPAGLQILSVTGFPGLSFLLMLSNTALALILMKLVRERRIDWPALGGIGLVLAVLAWGALRLSPVTENPFTIAVTQDLANGEEIQALSRLPAEKEGYYADTPEMSQALFDVNAALTRQAADRSPAFVVWPENEFADADDSRFTGQTGALARETGAYIVADTVWRSPEGMHDTALMVSPGGTETGRQAKIHLFSGEKAFGFVPGEGSYPLFATPYGQVGLGVCYDYHFTDVVRGLARNGADIILMPTDDDMSHNGLFPWFHGTDGVFRAVEHGVAFASAGTNGVSLVVDPYGRISAMSGVNSRSVVTGETFILPERTLYTRWGDWFGWLNLFLAVLLFLAVRVRRGRE